MPGEKNPADLLTKHLGSSEKLHQLVQLYGCHFLSGGAESAPKTRTQPTDKIRIAEADQLQGMEEQEEKGDGIMPHMMYTKEDLDVEYPSLQVPHDDALDDAEECDQVLEHGLKFARDITAKTAAEGRKRKPSTTTSPKDTTTTTTTSDTTSDNHNHNDHNSTKYQTEHEPKTAKQRVRFADEDRAHDEARKHHIVKPDDQACHRVEESWSSMSVQEWRLRYAYQIRPDCEVGKQRGFRERPRKSQ